MEYISVKEAAEKWGISERYVQRYCTQGRIEGATKFGSAWAIPTDAERPSDLRKNQPMPLVSATPTEVPVTQPIHMIAGPRIAMPLLNTAFTPGHCMDSIIKIEDTDSRNIALAEYYYFSGQPAKASDIVEEYLTSEDISLRASACWIYGYANLALDRIPRARKAIAQIQHTLRSIDKDAPPIYRALTVCIANSAATLLHLPLPEGVPSMKPFIHLLPPGLRLFVLYVQAHQAYLNQRYGACIGIVETALALEGDTYPIPSIYLHLVATMAYINLKETGQAREHLLNAWKLAQPDDLIQPLGEHHGLLGGMLEAVIKKEWPDDFRRIIAITYSFSAGWRKIHNPDTGHDVADDLTTTEFAIAMLAARGWSNKEISAHLGVSPNTVKLHISAALQKLNIEQRKELAQFMLK